MNTTRRYLLFMPVMLLLFSACHKSPKQINYIPKDATFVLGADPKSLAGKLQDSHLDMDSLFKTFGDTTTASQVGIKNWNDVKNSGLDIESEFFVFASTSGSVMSGQKTSTGVVAAMKSTSDFEAFLKKNYPSVDIKKASNYSYAVLKDGFAVGWNDDVAILSNVISYNYSSDQGSANPMNSDDSQKQLDALFTQKEDASVASISQFKDLTSQKADMLFWTNSSGTIASIPFLGMTKASDLLKDAYAAGTINFEDGKATMYVNSYSGKDLRDIMQKYAGPTVDMNMIERYPYPLQGYAIFSFNPQLIGAIVKYVGIDGTANQFMQQMGFSLDDVLKAFKGDFAIDFSDLGMSSKPNEFAPGDSIKTMSSKLVVNAAIGDKASYDKIAAALAANGQMVLQNGQYVFPSMNGFAMNTDNKNIIIASDGGLLQAYMTGAHDKASIPSEIREKTKGSAIAFYVDINSILKSVPVDDPQGKQTMDLAEQTFKNMIFTSNNFDGKNVTGYFRLNTMNDKENSLVSIIKFASEAAKQEKIREARIGMSDNNSMFAPAPDSSNMMVDTTEK